MNCDPRFLPLLSAFGLDAAEGDAGTIYGLWPDLTLAYMNRAWYRFAAENEGEPALSRDWTLGRGILDAVAPPLRPFYEGHYARCLREGRPWAHVYECSSARVYRQFQMTAFPLAREGLLVVNSLRVESSHTRLVWPPLERWYRDEHGLLVQCCHCRRIRRRAAEPVWDWVPEWVRGRPENVSHGLCEPCLAFYYGGPRPRGEHPVPFSTEEP